MLLHRPLVMAMQLGSQLQRESHLHLVWVMTSATEKQLVAAVAFALACPQVWILVLLKVWLQHPVLELHRALWQEFGLLQFRQPVLFRATFCHVSGVPAPRRDQRPVALRHVELIPVLHWRLE
jgi:hypothetical protein